VSGQAATNGAHVSHPANTKFGTGWISELNPRKGVLTFDNNGCDERVLFLASKVYFFEKRLGAKQSLNGETLDWALRVPEFATTTKLALERFYLKE
jgi:hypothetical protein